MARTRGERIVDEQLDFLVGRRDLRETRWRAQPLDTELAPGEALLAVDAFALTANNITYGVAGDSMNYWQFFPVDDHWGRIPVWGFADVVASAHPELPVGERLYGYYPMSSHLRIQADRLGARQLVDASAHRQGLPPVYNQYQRVAADPAYRRESESAQMLYRPLFTTSFLLDDFVSDKDFFGAEQVVLTSASSKTALGLAFLLHANRSSRGRPMRIVGLTSAANLEFVRGLGCYDRALSYDAMSELPRDASVIVDMAGNGEVLGALHEHLDPALRYSCLVGMTHWDSRQGASELAGPTPQLFFAPSQAEKRLADWGGAGFESRLAEAWAAFADSVGGWISVEHGQGRDAVESAYRLLLENRAPPDRGYVLSLGTASGA
jgi:hypothetical protein